MAPHWRTDLASCKPIWPRATASSALHHLQSSSEMGLGLISIALKLEDLSQELHCSSRPAIVLLTCLLA